MQHFTFVWLRLLNLDDHFRLGKNFAGTFFNSRTNRGILIVVKTHSVTAVVFNQNLVAINHQLTHTGGRQAYTVFMIFYFFGYTYQHNTNRQNLD